jgi:hypothetical protein
MDFAEYKAKMIAFHRTFLILDLDPNREIMTTQNQKSLTDIIILTVRHWMASAANGDYVGNIHVMLTDYLELVELDSIKKVDLNADENTLLIQAEAVKKDIILHGRLVKAMSRNTSPDLLPGVFVMNDFIRSPSGKIIYPFDYWEDCTETYIRKHFLHHSNERITRDYSFKTSLSGTQRAKLDLVARMIDEISLLKKTIYSNQFPPRKLKGAKQPSLNGVIS